MQADFAPRCTIYKYMGLLKMKIFTGHAWSLVLLFAAHKSLLTYFRVNPALHPMVVSS